MTIDDLRAEVERLTVAWERNGAGYGIPDPSWAYVSGALRGLLEERR